MYAESTTTEMTAYPGREPAEKATLRDFWAKESAVNAFLQTSHVNIQISNQFQLSQIAERSREGIVKGGYYYTT